MNILIHQNGLDVGPYTLEEATALLAAGILKDDDPSKPEGASDWAPLQKVISESKAIPSSAADRARMTMPNISLPKFQSRPAADAAGATTSAVPPSNPGPPSPTDEARTRVSPSKFKPRPAADNGRATTSSVSPSGPSPLTAKARARSAASAGSQPKTDRPASFLNRSPGSSSTRQKEKVDEPNQLLVSCVVGASILILIPILILIFAPDEVAKLLEPFVKVPPVSSPPAQQ